MNPSQDLATMGTPSRPLVTLFVMAYRQEDKVTAAVQAAFAQTYRPLEIILSDDCSPDGTFRIMEKLAAAYDGPHRVRLNRNERNLGITSHVSLLAKMAAGGLIVHAAGDDVSDPDRVARLADIWSRSEGRTKAIHSRVRMIDAAGETIGTLRPPMTTLESPSPMQIIETGGNCIGATLAFSRELVERFGPVPADCFVEDSVLFFRAAMLGGIAYIDAPLLGYRMDGLSSVRFETPAEREFHGHEIVCMRWYIPNLRCFIEDMEKVDFPNRAACLAAARRKLEDLRFRVRAAEAGRLGRLRMVPEALRLDARSGTRRHLLLLVKYALGRAYLRFYNSRQPWWKFAPPPGHPAARAPEWRDLRSRVDALEERNAARWLAAARVAPGYPPDVYVYLSEAAPTGEEVCAQS